MQSEVVELTALFKSSAVLGGEILDTMMSAVAPKSTNVLISGTDRVSKEVIEYEKILRLRDEVFENTHPRLKVPKTSSQSIPPSVEPLPPLAAPRITNGFSKLHQTNVPPPSQSRDSHGSTLKSSISLQKSPNAPRISTQAPGSSGIDPIFLTKSEVLVKAELQQKRHRIERALEEEVNHKKVAARQQIFDQDAIPDFDVADVLRKAQELVKPIKSIEISGANGNVSPSDSFDENTFYSSQMNDSTTEEADRSDKSPKPRPTKMCNYFLNGEHCRYGDACTFSHDPLLKQRKQADGAQAMHLDSVNADEQAILRPTNLVRQAPTKRDESAPPLSKLNRIAELEEQLRRLKSGTSDRTSQQQAKEPLDLPEEPMYSPPEARVPTFSQQNRNNGRIIEIEESPRGEPVQQRSSLNRQTSQREYNRRPPSPFSSDVRVVRSHITSPVAPQPARVSPLAVAKVPQISQGQPNGAENGWPSRNFDREVLIARPSSIVPLQPLSLRKRRREGNDGERGRNVAPRRELGSPEIRIKEEPLSPPPFAAVSENSQPRRRQRMQPPIHIDTIPPQGRDRDQVLYQPRLDHLALAYVPEERRPVTPVVRRIDSRTGHRLDAYDEPDLRRRVSARQLRAPVSPVEQYSIPHPISARAASQVYFPQPGLTQRYRASVQPQSLSNLGRDRSLSPIPRHAPLPPPGREPIVMAPPARRIVVDQHGNRFYEAPIPIDRQVSVAPVRRQTDFVPRYEHIAPSSASFRAPQLVNAYDDEQFSRRPTSPALPRYVDDYSPVGKKQVIDSNSELGYGLETYVPRDDIRMVEYSDHHPVARYEDVTRPREAVSRMQSVRPASSQYMVPREQQAMRVSSVRPEQDRIVSLGGRRGMAPQSSRQASIRPEEVYAAPSNYTVGERPRYQYTSDVLERRVVENDSQDDSDLYEAPRTAVRRPLQRL